VTGDPVVDVNAHIRLASLEQHGGIRLLRRGYNDIYDQDPDTGKLAAGLCFIAFQRDPHAHSRSRRRVWAGQTSSTSTSRTVAAACVHARPE
jgi:deferrochelatase/peroxidase EfeB